MIFTIVIILLLIGVGFIVFMYKEANADRVSLNHLSFENFPASFGEVKIFFISDIHKRVVSDKIIEDVRLLKPNIVIIGGDLVEKGVPLQRVKENLAKLKTLGPVYFVWGNNDYEVNFRELDTIFLDFGVKVLDNTAVSFESETGDQFILLGVDDMSKKRDRLDLALLDAGQTGFRVLVSHSPQIMSKIKKEHQISLVLSGHTHGGQIHILGYSPYEKGGIKKRKETTLLISNGYGTTALPLRLGAKAETHLITIKNGK
ncbi:metallophosphoesterase [Bacillus sp. DTU_2020_1000418_1_SI_GHA_SEK_038]|uniref:metallophosphoesterase n=1 Tax=Bacillus sp. DTU_2020_1000418_1_SI_GHA_SEK_038 TaxID=3077585 RepID=UPI0028EAC4DB|nr:metallophosphoesterase [Bacillus sp. DTU_2020_1000418_1_SI_GHA_SEK_038]WNS74059.1 metallophosphoesterase [Bacillus sp. DTU_2020_1000418_1_SI_GHA_SEK_038]